MADIELVIKIPEEVKNRLCFGVTYSKDIQVVCEALNDSTPLPKGHGKLIDADSMWDSYHDLDYDFYEAFDLADTIIEADNAESEEV